MQNDNSNKIEEIEKAFQEADRLILKGEKNIESFENFIREFEEMEKTFKTLDRFYFNEDWLKNKEFLAQNSQENFMSDGQDTIWNLYTEFYTLRLELLKKISDSLYEGQAGYPSK